MFGFVLAGVFVVVYVTSVAAHASVMAGAERRHRERHARRASADKMEAAAVDGEDVDTVAVVFLAASLFFGLYGAYALCSRPKHKPAQPTLPSH